MRSLSRLEQKIWQKRTPSHAEQALRLLLAVFRVVTQSQIKLIATSLTYHTLLAIVPLLAVLFTLLKSFGIERYLKELVNDLLSPMGSTGGEVSTYLFQFIGNAQAGILGSVGVLFLFYSIYNLFSKIEGSLNHLWHIERSRSLTQQLMSYLGVIMLAVIVATIALALNVFFYQNTLQTQWQAMPIVGVALTAAVKIASVVATAVMLAVIYSGAINTDVRFKKAFIGGLFCAILWLPLTAIFAKLMSLSSSYSVIYSSFAGLVILLVWLNILWALFLSGGLVTYFVQFPALLQPYSTMRLNPSEMEYYANLIVQTIVREFNEGRGETELATLIEISHLSHRQVRNLLMPFIQQGAIISTNRTNTRFLPAVNPTQLTSDYIVATTRGVIRNQHSRYSE